MPILHGIIVLADWFY